MTFKVGDLIEMKPEYRDYNRYPVVSALIITDVISDTLIRIDGFSNDYGLWYAGCFQLKKKGYRNL